MIKRIAPFLCIIFWIGCEDSVEDFFPTNPYDPLNEDYVSPDINFTVVPDEGSTLNTSIITIEWEGNQEGMSYRYAFDDLWEIWDENKSTTISNIDEGSHSISIQSKYPTGDTSEVKIVSFVVDAVQGPSILFHPRRHKAFSGEKIMFEILAEEVVDLAATSFKLNFNTNLVRIDSIVKGDYIGTNDESIFYQDIDNISGSVNVITALLGNNAPVFTGTASLAKLYITIKSNGVNQIDFDGTETFRNINNEIININSAIGGIVDQQ
jgi:hypothetical protein